MSDTVTPDILGATATPLTPAVSVGPVTATPPIRGVTVTILDPQLHDRVRPRILTVTAGLVATLFGGSGFGGASGGPYVTSGAIPLIALRRVASLHEAQLLDVVDSFPR